MTNAEVVVLFVVLEQGAMLPELLFARAKAKNICDTYSLDAAILSLRAQRLLVPDEKTGKLRRGHP